MCCAHLEDNVVVVVMLRVYVPQSAKVIRRRGLVSKSHLQDWRRLTITPWSFYLAEAEPSVFLYLFVFVIFNLTITSLKRNRDLLHN